MSDTKTMRVVPSGKVYRQMFDAQVKKKNSHSFSAHFIIFSLPNFHFFNVKISN